MALSAKEAISGPEADAQGIESPGLRPQTPPEPSAELHREPRGAQQHGRRARGARGKSKVVDIVDPPEFGSAPESIARGRHSWPGSSDDQAAQPSGKAAEPDSKAVRAFWERESRRAASPLQPRTSQASAGSSSADRASQSEAAAASNFSGDTKEVASSAPAKAAMSDRFGNPVMGLGVANGVSRALAAIEDFSQAIPALARFRGLAGQSPAQVGPQQRPQPSEHPEGPRKISEDPAAELHSLQSYASRPDGILDEPSGLSSDAGELTSSVAMDRDADRLAGADSRVETDRPRSGDAPDRRGTDANSVTEDDDQAVPSCSPIAVAALQPELASSRTSVARGASSLASQPSRRSVQNEEQTEPSKPEAAPTTDPLHLASDKSQSISRSECKGSIGSRDSKGLSVGSDVSGNETPSDDGLSHSQGLGSDSPFPDSNASEAARATGRLDDAPRLEAFAEPEPPRLPQTLDRWTEKDGLSTSPSAAAEDDLLSTGASEVDVRFESTMAASEDCLPAETVAVQGLAASSDASPKQPSGTAPGQSGRNDDVWGRSQAKQVFVLSNAGKPIFSLHGQEDSLAGFMAAMHAMISFAATNGDLLRSMRAGKYVVVFLSRGPLHLVAASSRGEPEEVLRDQLSLLHAQILCILTSGFERMFAKDARFDARRLLGGAEGVLRSLAMSHGMSAWGLLRAFPPLPLESSVRHACLVSLQAAMKAGSALYGVILAAGSVCALGQTRAHPLDQTDLLLLSNFVTSSEAFLQSPEHFTPVCLPAFNRRAFLHSYIRYIDKVARICIVFVSADQGSFHSLSSAADQYVTESKEVSEAIAIAAGKMGSGGQVRISELPTPVGGGKAGQTPLLHFLYKSPARSQHVAAAWTSPLDNADFRQEIMCAYASAHASIYPGKARGADKGIEQPARRVHFQQRAACNVLVFVGPEFELYAVFDVLADKTQAVRICQKLSTWVKKEQATLFIPL